MSWTANLKLCWNPPFLHRPPQGSFHNKFPFALKALFWSSLIRTFSMSLDTQIAQRLPSAGGDFPGTVWLEVTDRKQVIHKYFAALKVYLVCLLSRFPDQKGEADDLLQEFILKKILQPGWLENADPGKGRFRDFLKSSLRNFVVGEARAREADKRGGKNTALSLDDLEQEIAGPEPLSDSFDIAWLKMLLSSALEQMERSCAVSENSHIWKIFQSRVVQPALEGSDPLPYDQLVAQFGLKSPAQATNALATAKRMFARHLRAVVAQYETGDQAVRAEIDALRLFLDKLLPTSAKPKSTA
jgi:DNA-directed RNA polymerase specialized sigma24 family protein